MSRSCGRRSCASLPRRRASAAEVASLRAGIEALDRGLIDAGRTADDAIARADDLDSRAAAIAGALADARRAAGWPPFPGLVPEPLRLIPGGAA